MSPRLPEGVDARLCTLPRALQSFSVCYLVVVDDNRRGMRIDGWIQDVIWCQRLEVFWVGAYCRQRTPIHDALDFDDGGVEGFDGKWISLEGQFEMCQEYAS